MANEVNGILNYKDKSGTVNKIYPVTKTENVEGLESALNEKVSKVSGKGLSTNDYTTSEKNKLAGIADNANNYTLPAATSSALGGVKVGSNISNSSGTISLSKANVTAALGYTPPTQDTTYSAATTSAAGLMSASDKTKLDGIASNANNYTLPAATSSALGGVKIGSNISNSSGTISLSKANVTAALGYTPPTQDTTYSVATTSAAGLMSASDKTKLENTYTKSEVNTALNGKVSTQSGYGLISDADKSQIQTNKASIAAAETAIAGKASVEIVTQLQNDMAVQEARMDQLVGTVPEGSADEIADARVTADGKTETNLGNAIRSQVYSLKSDLDKIALLSDIKEASEYDNANTNEGITLAVTKRWFLEKEFAFDEIIKNVECYCGSTQTDAYMVWEVWENINGTLEKVATKKVETGGENKKFIVDFPKYYVSNGYYVAVVTNRQCVLAQNVTGQYLRATNSKSESIASIPLSDAPVFANYKPSVTVNIYIKSETEELKTLVNAADTIASLGLATTKRWFLNKKFDKSDRIKSIDFMAVQSNTDAYVVFEVWNTDGTTLRKIASTKITTGGLEKKVRAILPKFASSSDYYIAMCSNRGVVAYNAVSGADWLRTANNSEALDEISIADTSAMAGFEPSVTVYYYSHASTDSPNDKNIYVGPDEKYKQIQDAIDNIIDSKPHTIVVLASDTPYERFSMIRKKDGAYPWNNNVPKNISIIGSDRAHCIIKSNSGDYASPPAELLANGIIKNLTFVMTNDRQTESATQGGYAAHIDARTLNDVGYNMQIEDCDFISESGPAVGIGLHQNANLVFRRCRFTTTLRSSYNPHSGYKNLYEYGCFFCHTSQVSNAQNQRIWIEDCVGICTDGNKSIWLAPAGDYSPATSDFEYTLLRNVFWNKSTNTGAYNLVPSLKSNPMNFGNND